MASDIDVTEDAAVDEFMVMDIEDDMASVTSSSVSDDAVTVDNNTEITEEEAA